MASSVGSGARPAERAESARLPETAKTPGASANGAASATTLPDRLQPLSPDALCACCDHEALGFAGTNELEPLDDVIGQERAVEALQFGVEIRRQGYNIFAFGPAGTGKSTTLERHLRRHAAGLPTPDSWCYVANFGDRHHPHALRLPPGKATSLRQDMDALVETLLASLPAAFETETYGSRYRRLATEFKNQASAAFEAVQSAASKRGLTLVSAEDGYEIAPVKDGHVLEEAEYLKLPAEAQGEIRRQVETTEAEIEVAARQARVLENERQKSFMALDREVAGAEVGPRLAEVKARYADLPDILSYLDLVEQDIYDHLELFRSPADQTDAEDGGEEPAPAVGIGPDAARLRRRTDRRLRRYAVNVLVDNGESGAPVIIENHPTLTNLVGRIEHEQLSGALITDFSLIRPGALHRANGGFLVLEATAVLKQPHSWDALKRALRRGEVRIEAPRDEDTPATTITLEPEPIGLDVKVILLGDTDTYFLLSESDPDVIELFKVSAEFGDSMPRTEDSEMLMARFIAKVAAEERLAPFTADAVGRVIEYSMRLSGDAKRLSTSFLAITDLLREADYWAAKRVAGANGSAGSSLPHITRQDVEQAIAARVRRMDLSRELIYETYAREIVLIDTDHSAVGQVNGITVLERGNFAFGLPVRISATVRLGGGELLDIEREVDLGGPIHSKGVLILGGFLHGRYLPDEQLSMAASLAFEQSYGEVDGDSASSSELYALMSALSGLPVNQGYAVTGSVNQLGQVQAIGAVNEKVEGFFDICRERGLTGRQGVVIPHANVQHLMLRDDVIEAVQQGRFAVYAVSHVDEGIELLTGRPAGARGADGLFPAGSVNRLIEDRLRALAEKRKESGAGEDEDVDDESADAGHERRHHRPGRPRR